MNIVTKALEELKNSNIELQNKFIEFVKCQQTKIVPINNPDTKLKVMMKEILDNQKQPSTIINTNNTINNNFNINVFLKKECNEAINMDHFAKNI